MKAQMRLLFDDADLKVKLVHVAELAGISLNELVNLILVSRFNQTQKFYLDMLFDLVAVKENEIN